MPQILWWKLTETWFCGGSTFHREDFRIQWSYRRLQGRLWNGWGRALLHPFRTCWSSVPKGSPSGWEPCPATAGARLNAARSSKECSWRSVAWETDMFFSFQGSGAEAAAAAGLVPELNVSAYGTRAQLKGSGDAPSAVLTCIRPPSPWRSSCEWCTSGSAGRPPRSPGWPTGPAGLQTLGCWRFLDYNLGQPNRACENTLSNSSNTELKTRWQQRLINMMFLARFFCFVFFLNRQSKIGPFQTHICSRRG